VQLYQAILALTKHKQFFPNLEHISRARLLWFAQGKTFKKGDVIYHPQSTAAFLYFIVEGSVELEFKNNKTTLSVGEHFGNECVLSMNTYATHAVATTNVSVLMIPKHAIEKIVDHKDFIAHEFAPPFIKCVSNLKIKVSHENYDELSQEKKASRSKITGWFLTIFASIFAYAYLDNFDHSTRMFIAICVNTIIVMGFKLLDDYIATIFAILLCLGFGITSVENILSSYASTSCLTALSFFGIGSVILSSGLILRVLVSIIKYFPSKHAFINSGLFLMGGVLTPLIPDLGIRSEMISNTFYDTFKLLNLKPKSTNNTSLAFLFFSSISILGPVFLSSCMDNFIILALFWAQYQQAFQWLGWLKAALVPGMFMIVGYSLVHILMFRKQDPIEISKTILKAKSQALGPLNTREWIALLSIITCFLGMTTSFYHHVSPEIVSFLVLSSLLAFNFISQEEFRSKIPWDDLIFFTGLSGVIATANDIGFMDTIGTELSWIANYMESNFPIFILSMLGLMTAISFIFPIEFVTISFLVILVPIAQFNSINPWVIAFVLLMLGEVWFHPMQKSDYRWFNSLITEECAYDERKLLRANALLSLVKIAALFASIPYWRSLGLLS
jgi:DASS family divalent anion:Na+ symporter